MPSFSLGLDTPSKLFSSGPTGLTPASWSLGGTGLTPSILGAFSSSGWTPSLTSMAGAKSELNPFELSLSSSATSSSSSKRKTGVDFLDREEAGVRGSPGSMFDLLATTPSGGGTTGRKRALSSPAIELSTSSSFPFLSQPSHLHPESTEASSSSSSSSLLGQRSKRPRMAAMQSSALTTNEPFFSSFERESDESPPSSVVLTPPDSAPLYSSGLASNDGQAAPAPQEPRDISVVPLSGPSKPPGIPLAQSTNLLSRLAQERSALIAAGGGIAHAQAQPLPIAVKPVATGAVDIAVKAEPADESAAVAAAVAVKTTSPVRPIPVTRGQSKRGGKRAAAAASTTAPTAYTSFNFGPGGPSGGGETASPSSTSNTPATKRKAAPRKKSAAARKKEEKENSASMSAMEGDDDEDGEAAGGDSTKRQQFLERNRVAACKSRQKKKEKVAGLEQFAADLCARNHKLQQTALALRQEALALRQLVHAHIGCSCEHAQGYIARDAAGGGIATIDQLAGRVMTLDYSVPPAMGTEDDVYSFLDRGDGPPDSHLHASPSRSAQQPPLGSAPGPAIPIVARPTAAAGAGAQQSSSNGGSFSSSSAASNTSMSPVRCTGMMTRRSSMAVHAQAQQQQQHHQTSIYGSGGNGNDAAFRAAVTNNHLGLSMHDGSMSGAPFLRATSAPPTTPGWGDAAPTGDYFAPKRARASIAA
ncbi:hypothetical protein JCM10908_006307 [Rhodotorula pacifica]|uniref:bZIP transcription factor n=1 Tax=Rhodotorula pacifica TaxID=1495444 RepID=UPI00317363E4